MTDRCARCRHDFADHMDSPDEACSAPGCWCSAFKDARSDYEEDEEPEQYKLDAT